MSSDIPRVEPAVAPSVGPKERARFELTPCKDLIISKLEQGYSCIEVWRWLTNAGMISLSLSAFKRFLKANWHTQPQASGSQNRTSLSLQQSIQKAPYQQSLDEPTPIDQPRPVPPIQPSNQPKPKVRSTPPHPAYEDSVPRDSDGRVLTIREREQQTLKAAVERILKVQRAIK